MPVGATAVLTASTVSSVTATADCSTGTSAGSTGAATGSGAGVATTLATTSFGTAGSGIIGAFANFPTPMRADPTLTVYDIAGNSARVTILDTGAANTNNITLNTSNATQTRMMVRIYGNSAAGMCFMYQVSAEL